MKFLQTLGLKSKNPDTRRETVENLARESDPEVLKHLYPMLEDADAVVRREAVKAIASFREAESIPFLEKAFSDKDPEVRSLAAGSLSKFLVPEAIMALKAGLRNPDFGVRKKAATALEARGWRPGTSEDRVLAAMASGRLMDAVSEGEMAIEPLAEVFQAESASMRKAAIEALSSIESPKTFRYIATALKDAEPSVRVAAVDSLQRVRDARVFEPLAEALKDRDHRVRHIATQALGNIGGIRAVAPLVGALKDVAIEVRIAAAEGLGKTGDARATEALISALKDREQDVRCEAVKALGKLRHPQAIGPLVAMLKDSESTVRSLAGGALNAIDPNWQKNEAARDALPELQTALYDREYWVRQSAAKTLSQINETQAPIPQLPSLQMAGGSASPLEDTAASGLEPILIELEDANPSTRYRAAVELRQIQNPRAIPALVRRLFDDEDTVRRAAAEALEVLQWNPDNAMERALHAVVLRKWDSAVELGGDAVEPLLKALDKFEPPARKAAAEALGNIGDPRAVDPLMKALSSSDFGIRKAAAEALGKIGDPQAIPALIEAQSDKFKMVRDAAEQALMRLGGG